MKLRVYKLCLISQQFNPLNAELNPICYLLALLGAHHFLYVSRIKVKIYIKIGFKQTKTWRKQYVSLTSGETRF